jgi:hypothetical protein
MRTLRPPVLDHRSRPFPVRCSGRGSWPATGSPRFEARAALRHRQSYGVRAGEVRAGRFGPGGRGGSLKNKYARLDSNQRPWD